jgi:hypothetical protein
MLDKKTLHCVTKSTCLLPFPVLDLRRLPFKLTAGGFGSIVNARFAAAAPKRVLATTTREKI